MTIPHIIGDDPHYLFISKPACYDSAEVSGGRPESVVSWLKKQFPEIGSYGYSASDHGLLNRLDYETSGLLIAAKSAEARDSFIELSKRGGITKRYQALVEGLIEKPLDISAHIGARGRSSQSVRTFTNPRKKDRALPAYTHCKPLAVSDVSDLSIIEVSITVGRRHQIRVHMAHAGHPLMGDTLYGSHRTLSELRGITHPSNFILHSVAIDWTHPVIKTRSSIECPLPEALINLRKNLAWRKLL